MKDEVEKLLNDFRQSTIVIHAQDSVRGPAEDARAFKSSLDQTTDALLALFQTAQVEAVRAARIDELERLYLVFGSKDQPASLDNLFSLGKKGEVAATPIKDRLVKLKEDGETK